MKLRIATRGSQLALWQAETVRTMLEREPEVDVCELVVIRSSGDRDQTSDLARFGRIGIFTVEVDRALLEGRADIAVHSLKDMTTELQAGIELAGVLARGPVEDVLVSSSGVALDALPRGARVGTGSLRRAAMVLAARPDLEVVGMRGNIETRLAKLHAGEAEALVLARAGVERLGLVEHVSEVLPLDRFVPAVGQGIVGLTCYPAASALRELLARVRDRRAWASALAERAFLRTLRGGCNVSIGAHARHADGRLELTARVLAPDGSETIDGARAGTPEAAEALGVELADELLGRGAERLLEVARS